MNVEFQNKTKKTDQEFAPLHAAIELGVSRSGVLVPVSGIYETRLNKAPYGNFQEGLHPVRFVPDYGSAFGELRIDVGRIKSAEGLAERADHATRLIAGIASPNGVFIDNGMVPPDLSKVWEANSEYWRTIGSWTNFGSQLPSGESDSVNPGFWKDRVAKVIVPSLKQTESKNAHPKKISFLELGAAGGETADIMIKALEREAKDDPELSRLLRKTVVYLADYSEASIDEARARFVNSSVTVEYVNGDLTHPKNAFPELRDRHLAFVHAGNFFDNLPTRQVAERKGGLYEERVSLYLERIGLNTISGETGLSERELERTFRRVIAHNSMTDEASIKTWEAVWLRAARFKNEYQEITDGTVIDAAGFSIGKSEIAQVIPKGGEVPLSDQAAMTLGNVLELMHPDGIVQIVDLFKGARTKLAGSLYNPVNAAILALVAARYGFASIIEPFGYNPKSHSSVFTASRAA